MQTRTAFYTLLWILSILTILNLLLTASIVGLIGAAVILMMVWSIARGNYALTSGLGVLLVLYGTVNLAVAAVILIYGRETGRSSLLWLAVYSCAIVALGAVLRGKRIQNYLKTAPPPERKEPRFHFFHGGWRDL